MDRPNPATDAARPGRRQRALDRLAAAQPALVWSSAVAAMAVVAVADWYSGAEVAASLAYLLPVALVAWARGRAAAALVAVSCAFAWLAVDIQTHWAEIATSVELINVAVLCATLLLFGQLLACLRERLDGEHRLAFTDSLTGLHNRRALWSATAREIERCRRSGTPFSFAYLDVDGFKSVNDQHGHSAGDELLRAIAATMRDGFRPLDMVARLGGDEFAVLLPGADPAGARAALNRLQQRLQQAPWRGHYEIDFSLGCLTVLVPPMDVDMLVARADELMYEMKRDSRGAMRLEVVGADEAEPVVLIPRPATAPAPRHRTVAPQRWAERVR